MILTIDIKRNLVMSWLTLALIMILAGACSPFVPKARTVPVEDIPETFSLYPATPSDPDRWWLSFESPVLNRLLDEAFAGNFSLRQAWARLEQARALAVQAGADLYPDLRATGGTTHARQRTDNGTADTFTTRHYSLGLSSRYEIDLWGRIRAEQTAGTLAADATLEDWNATVIALAAEVTTSWAQIISQQMQLRLLDEQLKTNRTYLELVELRYRKGMVSALDVFQQKQIVENVRAQIPLAEAREQLFRNQLAVLLGKAPGSRLDIGEAALPIPEDIPAVGLPADLLASRPDVRAAGLRLTAADWQLAAARAGRLPAISLTGTVGYGPADIDRVLDNWILSLASNLVAPILDGGRRAAEVDRTRAVIDENLAAYGEIVLIAIREVEDALVSETGQRRHIAALGLQLDAARKALVEARARYRKGIDDYLPVLTQLLSVQNLERDLIQQQAELLIDRIDLYEALGGSWPDSLQAGR